MKKLMKFFVFKVRKLIQKVFSSFNLQYFDVAYSFLKRKKNKWIYYLLHEPVASFTLLFS